MKILYFIGAYGRQYAANEIHSELGHEFARAGHRCLVLAPISQADLGGGPLSYDDGPVAVERFLADDIPARRLLAGLSWRLFHYPYFLIGWLRLREFLRCHPDIEVIHADAVYPMGAIAALAGSGVPLVPSVHGGDLIDRPDYGYGRFPMARALTRHAFRHSALVRINSPLMARLAQERGCPPEKVRLLVVNIGDRFFAAGEGDLAGRRQQARSWLCGRHGLDPEALLLLSMGRLIPLKGVEEVVRAAELLARRVPRAHLLIAGPSRNVPGWGDSRAYLEALARSLGVGERVTFLGPLDYEEEVPRTLLAADLFLSPSHIEGLNRVVAEAGVLGTPSIVSEGTGIAPLVSEMGAGRVVPVGDVAALAAAAAELADPAVRQAAGERSRALAQRFRSSEVARGLLEIYSEAVRR